MVQGYTTSNSTGTGRKPAGTRREFPKGSVRLPTFGKAGEYRTATGENNGRHPSDDRAAHTSAI